MAIKKRVPAPEKGVGKTKDITLPAFSFSPNDDLAGMIAEAWANKTFRDGLTDWETTKNKKPTDAAVALATASVNARGFNLKRAVVMTEKMHDSDTYIVTDADEVVFVLPNNTRLGTPYAAGSKSLLDTAKLLMACTPNGI